MKKVITIWTRDIDHAQSLWEDVLCPDGWDIKKPISVKFNWGKFTFGYQFEITK